VAAVIEAAARLEPDVVLMDVRLPDGSGVTACREIRAANPRIRILFLTTFRDDSALLKRESCLFLLYGSLRWRMSQ
jgi:two-component system, NarL family, response regulator DevR